MTQVYLKIQKHKGSSQSVDVIPLFVESVRINVDKTIPNIPIPLSGLFTGESTTAALDLGMSNKRISLTGFLMGGETQQLARSHTSSTPLTFTAQEIAQIIASGVDSTGLARYQAINELVVLMPSSVDENYAQRTDSDNNVVEKDIALSFAARGASLKKDNQFVALPKAFPLPDDHADFSGHKGLSGFIQSFSYDLQAETVEVSFNLEFVIANVIP